MVEQADSGGTSTPTEPELDLARSTDTMSPDDFVAAVEQRAARKGDRAGHAVNWRRRRRVRRLTAAFAGLLIVAATAAGAYFYREGGGDPWADTVAAVESATDTAAETIESWSSGDDTAAGETSVTATGGLVNQEDQEVIAYNANTPQSSSDSDTETGTAETTAIDTVDAASGDVATDDTETGATEAAEPDVAGADVIDSEATEIDVTVPEIDTVDPVEIETPETALVVEPEGADNAAGASYLVDQNALDDNVATASAAETETSDVESEPDSSEVVSTEDLDAVADIAPVPETPPSSDDNLADDVTSETIVETAPEPTVPQLPADNIADIDAVMPNEVASEEPVAVAEVTEVSVPVERLPVMSAFSHTGTRVQLADYGTEEQAQDGWLDVKSDLRGVIGDYRPIIEEESLGAGMLYRLQIGYFDSPFAAVNFCNAVMDRKVTCTVIPQ